MKSINPATGKIIKTYVPHTSAQAAKIVQKAHQAFEEWRRLSLKERGRFLKKAAALLLRDKDDFACLIANEMGKPFRQGRAEIEKCAWVCEYYAAHAEEYLRPEFISTQASRSYVAFEPLGTVLAVMPWNFPFWQVIRCAAPTLMAGNAMVLKHASNVCGCAHALEDVFMEAGCPKGLFRALFIDNAQTAEVIAHPLISAVTLTGSTPAGKAVASTAGAHLKKTVLELGGNDPYIVLKDADIEKAAQVCASSRLINGGQSCISAKRFIVEAPLFKEFTERVLMKMRAEVMGPPLNAGVTLGPMARHDLRDQLHADVMDSVQRGAQLLLGGFIPEGPGAFYPPTVLINVRKGMPAYEKEMFGPVAVILKAGTEREALRIANDTIYGLGAAVFSRNIRRAEFLAVKEVNAGCCFVNESVRSDPRLPFGGIKESGYGRELSRLGIREFVNAKTVYIK